MNVTFDHSAAMKLFRVLRGGRSRKKTWLRVTAVGDHFILEAGDSLASIQAMVLQPGGFSTNRRAFEQLLRTFKNAKTITLQADAGRFRIGSFSGQLLDYDARPALPEGFPFSD